MPQFPDPRRRAIDVFELADRQILADCKAIAAKPGAKGAGATAIRSIEVFEQQSTAALSQILGEVATVINGRGKRWSSAMAGVRSALDEHVNRAPEILASNFRLAEISGAAEQAATARLEEVRQRLDRQLNAFADGWTSPVGKPWRERHALLYAVLVAAAGALISQGISLTIGHFSSSRSPSTPMTPTPSAKASH